MRFGVYCRFVSNCYSESDLLILLLLMSRVIKRGVYVKVGITCFCHRDTEATQQDLGKIGWHQITAKQDKTRAACMIPGKYFMMTSSNGNNFRVTGLLCGNSPVTGEFPAQRPVTRSFDVFFDLHMNKRKSKQSHYDVTVMWYLVVPCPSLLYYCSWNVTVLQGHYSDVTWALWRLKSLAYNLTVCSTAHPGQ